MREEPTARQGLPTGSLSPSLPLGTTPGTWPAGPSFCIRCPRGPDPAWGLPVRHMLGTLGNRRLSHRQGPVESMTLAAPPVETLRAS